MANGHTDRPLHPVVVHCILLQRDQVYLMRRFQTGFADGYYSLPGGYWEAGESLHQACARECAEEAGVTLSDSRLLTTMTYRRARPGPLTQGINAVFVSESFSPQPKIMESHLCDQADFYDINQLPEPLIGWVGELLKDLPKLLGGNPALRELLYP